MGGRTMNLSHEMTRYMTTGRCPHCGVVILTADYVRKNSALLKAEAVGLANNPPTWPFWQTTYRHMQIIRARALHIVPFAAKVEIDFVENMQCQTCMKKWPIAERSFHGLVTTRLQTSSYVSRSPLVIDPAVTNPRAAGAARIARTSRPKPSSLAPKLDLTDCRVTGIKEERQLETPLPEERKQYPNNSHAIFTKELGISNSVTLSVTIESSKVRAHNAEAGITILGFAAIQGQVQQQLSHAYSVTTENTFTISEKTTIQIPPSSTVEHIIRWKVISLNGVAVLGKAVTSSSLSSLAEVPYRIPLRLTYTEEINDVPHIKRQ